MPTLSNPKHELFAQHRAKGATIDFAYVQAGFKRNRSNAAQLNAKQHIAARIEELQQVAAKKVEKKLEIDAEKTLIEAARLAFSDIRKLFDEDGNLKAVHELDDDTAGAIKKVKVTTLPGKKDEEPTHVTEIEFWSKTDAIGKLGQHFKIFGNGETAEDPLKRFAELMMQAAARPLPLAEPTTPALTQQATEPARRPSQPIEDAKVIDRVEVEP